MTGITHPAQYTAESLRLQADRWFPRLTGEEHAAFATAESALRRIADEDLRAAPSSCQVVDVEGTPVRLAGAGDLTDLDRHHLAEIVAAAKRRYEADTTTDGPSPTR